MGPELEIIAIGIVLVLACAIPGVFLVLRGMSLMSDAISHAALLGIVLAFFVVKSLGSPWLIIGASIMGVITVTITEWVLATKRLKKDAAIGLVFPIFFSIGVILITKFMGNIHLDSDCVLFGEIAFAPFERVTILGTDLGPVSLWVMGIILGMNSLFLGTFYKELKLSTFDKGLAHALGFSPVFIHYGLMFMTSVTAVGAFESVGSILVVALLITPAASAYLLTSRVSTMLAATSGFGIMSVFGGYAMAYWLDVSISGMIVCMAGLLFTVSLLISPKNGLIIKVIRHRAQQLNFKGYILLVQLINHEGKDNESTENTISNMVNHMGIQRQEAKRISAHCVRRNYITRNKNQLKLTPLGRETAAAILSGTYFSE